MKSPIKCSNPKCDEQIGWHYTYPWTDRGCDPPEDIYYNEDYIDSDGAVYCSRECMDEVGAHEEACHYCGEPLEDGLCSASCEESADDEGRIEE